MGTDCLSGVRDCLRLPVMGSNPIQERRGGRYFSQRPQANEIGISSYTIDNLPPIRTHIHEINTNVWCTLLTSVIFLALGQVLQGHVECATFQTRHVLVKIMV